MSKDVYLEEMWVDRTAGMKQWDLLRLATMYTLKEGWMYRDDVFREVPHMVHTLFGIKKDWSHNQSTFPTNGEWIATVPQRFT